MATTNDRLYPKPDPVAITPETVEDAFNILRQALDMVDNDVVALLSSVSGKAAAAHGHAIADITGLAAAITAKMDASATFDLDWLNNVYSTAAASDGFVLVKTPTGWTAASAASVIGAHSHAMGDIVGLSAALLTKADATALAAYAQLSGASFSGSVTAVGDILTSGNLRTNGGIVYLNSANSAYIYWDGTKYTTHLGDIHHDGNAARRPQTAAGSGQWVRIYPGENANCVLPSGGTWAWFVYLLTGTGAEFTGYHAAGVNAGGTALYAAQGTNTYWCGFAWRVSE